MPRNVLPVLVSCCALVLSGCGLFGRKAEPQTQAALPVDSDFYASVPIEDSAPPLEPYYEPTARAEPTGTVSRSDMYLTGATGSRYHTVAKRDTLYSLARSYYGDQTRWKTIFEANRDSISDANMIHVGQRLLIP